MDRSPIVPSVPPSSVRTLTKPERRDGPLEVWENLLSFLSVSVVKVVEVVRTYLDFLKFRLFMGPFVRLDFKGRLTFYKTLDVPTVGPLE